MLRDIHTPPYEFRGVMGLRGFEDSLRKAKVIVKVKGFPKIYDIYVITEHDKYSVLAKLCRRSRQIYACKLASNSF